MRSEMRRMAAALVETQRQTFATRHPLAESKSRLDAAIASRCPRMSIVETQWIEDSGGDQVEVRTRPAPGIRRLLAASSIVLTLLIAFSVWIVFTPQESTSARFLVPLATLLAILGFPLVIVGFGSHREAENERLRRAIRHALLDEAEYPKPLRDQD